MLCLLRVKRGERRTIAIAEIEVDVEYMGLIVKLAGREREQYTLPEGANVETLLQLILSRHEALAKGKGALLIAVNKKALPAHPPAWREQILAAGDKVMLGVKIIGG